MPIEGGCYCGAVRYVAEGAPVMKAECHCRECQYISGGGPNFFMMMPEEGFAYVKGEPARFARADLETPRTREFCPTCGTHLTTRLPGRPLVVLKTGTLDDPKAAYGGPDMAIFDIDRQPWFVTPPDMPCFERLPPAKG